MLSENAFKEMPTLADKSSDFGFSSGIQVYFWTQRRAPPSGGVGLQSGADFGTIRANLRLSKEVIPVAGAIE